MRAMQISEFGECKVLRLVELPQPVPTADQVLVRVNAAGVNPIDFKTRKGLGFVAQYLKDKLPWTPGFDFAGEIVAVGSAVKNFHRGDAVTGFANFPQGGGAYAEYLAVDAHQLVRKPPEVSFITAGALPVAGLTAYQALFELAGLHAQQRVLILAGAGGVGHLAIQLAKLKNAWVAATASSKKLAWLRALGADRAVDYTAPDSFSDLGLFDVVIDNVGGAVGMAALELLAPQGRLVTIPTVTAADIITKAHAEGKTAVGLTVHFNAAQLNALLALLSEGKLKLHIEKSYLLEEAALAHADMEQGRTSGKRVLLVA